MRSVHVIFVACNDATISHQKGCNLQQTQADDDFDGFRNFVQQIDQHEVEGCKVVVRNILQGFSGVAVPPLDPRIVIGRSGSKILERGSARLLVEFHADHQFEIGVFQHLVQDHVVSSSYIGDPLDVLHVLEGMVDGRFVVMRPKIGSGVQHSGHVHVGVIDVVLVRIHQGLVKSFDRIANDRCTTIRNLALGAGHVTTPYKGTRARRLI
mmetsp:Transcript_24730/g.52406  ORF Transcript_24730/g.52406 Transcript_24730/m.52406 type:complete len:210 (+) Transcript_24730:3053-3682(+)